MRIALASSLASNHARTISKLVLGGRLFLCEKEGMRTVRAAIILLACLSAALLSSWAQSQGFGSKAGLQEHRAVNEASQRYLGKNGCNSIYVDHPDNRAVLVFEVDPLTPENRKAFPSEINGIPVVLQTGHPAQLGPLIWR